MADNLYLDVEGANGVVSDINGLIEEIQKTANLIDGKVLKDLPLYWKGHSAEKTQLDYTEQYQKIITSTLPTALDELKTFMSNCIGAINQTDMQLSGR